MKDSAGLSFVVDPPDIAPPILRPVLDYWEQKRGSRPMPMRHDIEPSDLKAYLPHLCLIEVMQERDFRYRLVGSAITERYGRNSTGKTVREIYANQPDIAEWFVGMMSAVTSHRRPVLATGSLRMVGKEHLWSEALMLPLCNEEASVTMILSVTRFTPAVRGGAAAPT